MAKKVVPGLYETVITLKLDQALESEPDHRVDRSPLAEDAHVLLTRHLGSELHRALKGLAGKPSEQAALINRLLETLDAAQPGSADDPVKSPPEALHAIGTPHPRFADQSVTPPRPSIPLSSSDLLVNARHEPRVGHVLKQEIPSADRIDLLCAFIRWHGLRILHDELQEHVRRGKKLRVLTTTYMGATERKALDALYEMHPENVEIRVCYEEKTTRLHAKAWLLHRNSGFSTAFVGSSNLSHSALMDGMEWNVRLSHAETPAILEKFRATFEDYWEDPLFEPYAPARDSEKLDRAVAATKGTDASNIAYVDLRPYPHQTEILEKLKTERERHQRFRNLVVAATGTGKTMVAAFDFARHCRENPDATLLFVAHRKEILQQSLVAFRTVLRDGAFGELWVDAYKPTRFEHVFASIQTLSNQLESLNPDAFDFVIVDEFHHAAARTYDELLEHIEPKVLVGLTATPERGDGQSVLHWFDGRMAAEIRLWEALDRQLLVPFQYFGLHDNTDLGQVTWAGGAFGKYNQGALENLYTNDHARVDLVLRELQDKLVSVGEMKALGFCVGIDHAEFMAREFNKRGIPSIALTSQSSKEERDSARQRLVSGELACIFTVDLFNEGVDIPEVDTVLFLRPTESVTVFLQQLGRGLRHAPNKSCLTVMDFIGNANKNFRFDHRYRALTGTTRRELEEALDDGFPYLPAGCSIELDAVAKDIVLKNVKEAVGSTMSSVVGELRSAAKGKDIGLAEFIHRSGMDIDELYQTKNWYFTKFRREAGLPTLEAGPNEDEFGGRLNRILHIDAADRLAFYQALLKKESVPREESLNETQRNYLFMLHFALWGDTHSSKKYRDRWPQTQDILDHVWAHPAIKHELLELLTYLDDHATHVTKPLAELGDEVTPELHTVPLSLHARYTLAEIRTAFGLLTPENSNPIREGVRYLDEFKSDLFFVTLDKTEAHYSPQTMYQDYAISPTRFHWESQWNTSESSPTGERYIQHESMGTNVLLFVRQKKKIGGQSQPYVFLGPAVYESHEGERPMAVEWRLKEAMPSDWFLGSKVVAG